MIKESPNSSEKHNRLTIKKGELIMFPTHFDIGQRNLEKEGPLTFCTYPRSRWYKKS